MLNSAQHCGEHWLVWGIPVAAVAHSLKSWNRQYQAIPCNTTPYNTKPVKFRAPVKELEWTNMGLGFLRTTRRASETQILENWSLWTDRLSLWNMWTGHVSRVKYLQTSCYPMSIYEGACEFVKIFYVVINIVQYKREIRKVDCGVMGDWKPLSWQEIIETHVVLLTSLQKKTAIFSDKASDDKMLNISKHSGRVWQVVHHRVTYRAVIPKIGHILSPSERANQKHPTMQIKRQLKKRQSKI